LCDLAADARAATPTAAGVLVVPSADDLHAALVSRRERAAAALRRVAARDRERTARMRERLHGAVNAMLERRRAALDRASARLQALSPLATLERGYAIVRAEGIALRDATQAPIGTRLDVQLARGALAARVEEVLP
jgi:exodeoxyribonuclease VII large subunit